MRLLPEAGLRGKRVGYRESLAAACASTETQAPHRAPAGESPRYVAATSFAAYSSGSPAEATLAGHAFSVVFDAFDAHTRLVVVGLEDGERRSWVAVFGFAD